MHSLGAGCLPLPLGYRSGLATVYINKVSAKIFPSIQQQLSGESVGLMIMGSRVRISFGKPFDILRFARNLLFPFFKNSGSDVDERGHQLRFFHAQCRGVVESFSIYTHEVSGSTPVVQVTVHLSGRIIPAFLGKLLALERNYSGFGLQHPKFEKKSFFLSKFLNWSGFNYCIVNLLVM